MSFWLYNTAHLPSNERGCWLTLLGFVEPMPNYHPTGIEIEGMEGRASWADLVHDPNDVHHGPEAWHPSTWACSLCSKWCLIIVLGYKIKNTHALGWMEVELGLWLA